MGLDMFLKLKSKRENKVINHELYYWRKANQIRDWFVHNIEGMTYESNCEEYTVPRETLEKLIDDITLVLDDHSKASEILPTSRGFFFGSDEYDDWYFEELGETRSALTEILKKVDFETHEVLYDEWW